MRATLRAICVFAGAAVLVAPDARAQEAVSYAIVGLEIPEPLTDQPGNPGRGKQIVADAENVTCLICHVMPIAGQPDMGEIGPPLDGVGGRYTTGELRLRVVDPKAINPETIMPSYYRTEGLYQVYEPYVGRTIYTAQQVEDVVAYLASLTDGS